MGVLGIGVDVESEVVLPDGSRVVSRGSSTTTFRQHVVSELFAPIPTAVVRPVDRVCVVSIGGTVEDCTTSLSWDGYPYGITNYIVRIRGYIMVSASYMVGYVRIKAGDVVYFESSVSSPFYVFLGQVVYFTLRLTFSTVHSPSVGGGLPDIIHVSSWRLLGLLADILRGARPADMYLTLERARWEEVWGETILDVPLTRSYTAGATSGSAFHDFYNFMTSGDLYSVVVDCVGRQYCLTYYLSSFLGVTTNDRARFSVSIDVSYWLGLSDGVDLSLDDEWVLFVGSDFDLVDSVGFGLTDGWSYVLAEMLGLSDSAGLGLSDSWSYSVAGLLSLGDSVGFGLSDGWVVWMDEIQLVSFVGGGVSYPAVVDVNDLIVSTVVGGVSYPAVVDVNDLIVSTVSGSVSYPAIVDVIDLVVGAGVSVG